MTEPKVEPLSDEPEWLARIQRHAGSIQSTEDAEKFAQTCLFLVTEVRRLRARERQLLAAIRAEIETVRYVLVQATIPRDAYNAILDASVELRAAIAGEEEK